MCLITITKHLSRLMGKPTICICENKGADQLRSNCEADQRLCFRYTDSTIPLLFKSKISSLLPSSVLVQLSLCRTCSETTLLVFPRGGSFEWVIYCRLMTIGTIHHALKCFFNTNKQYFLPKCAYTVRFTRVKACYAI